MLRGINVSGQKKISMIDLKKLFESLGFKNVRTYIQSGNVIFEDSSRDILKIRNKIEKKIKETFGFEVVIIIRTTKELLKIIENNPFSKKVEGVYVSFLSNKSGEFDIKEINKFKDKSEEFVIFSKEVYFYCPNGYGRTKLNNNFFEKKLKVSATTRNWKTVNALCVMSKNK